MKLDTEGRLKQLWVFPKGENGKEKPGDLNWIHGMAIARDGTFYAGDGPGKAGTKICFGWRDCSPCRGKLRTLKISDGIGGRLYADHCIASDCRTAGSTTSDFIVVARL